MIHATDSLLLAYHDGEIDGSALAELRAHLASCAQCMQELDELRRMSGLLHEALALTDVPAPAARRVAAVAQPAPRSTAWRWVGMSSLAKAAMLLLALTGVLTAIPGTPPRRAVELLLARLFDRTPAEEVAPAPAAVPVPTIRELYVEPAAGQLRVVVHGALAVDVTVGLIDGAKASVETSAVGQEVRWVSADGRAEISGLEDGTLRIGIPRAARRATIEFDGRVLVRLRDGMLQLEGRAGDARGDEVSFRLTR
jgi:hypothetical protein